MQGRYTRDRQTTTLGHARSPQSKLNVSASSQSKHLINYSTRKPKSRDRTSGSNVNQVHNTNSPSAFGKNDNYVGHSHVGHKMNATVACSLMNNRPTASKQQRRDRISSREFMNRASRASAKQRSNTLSNFKQFGQINFSHAIPVNAQHEIEMPIRQGDNRREPPEFI